MNVSGAALLFLAAFAPAEGASTAADSQPPAASAERVDLDLPLRFHGTRPAAEVMVNGRGPYLFLIDTGAGGPPTRADALLVRELGIAVTGSTSGSDAGGREVPIDTVRLDRLQLGAWQRLNLEGLTRDYGAPSYMAKIMGIIGLSFFQNHLVTFDFPRGRLRVSNGALPPPDGRTVLPLELIEGNAYVPVTIGGVHMNAILDTGLIRGFDLPSAALRPMRLHSAPRAAGNSSSISGQVPLREARLHEPLLIGGHRVERPLVSFSDDFTEANLGSEMLQEFEVTIDLRNRRVRFARPR